MPEKITHPRLRYVDAFPFEQSGQTLFFLRDPLEIATHPLIMSAVDFFIITLFDGVNSTADIKIKFARKFGGILLTDEQVNKIIEVMDANFYLETPAFGEHYRKIREDFKRAPVRKPWHSGNSYQADSGELARQIESFYLHPDGAGLLNGKKMNSGRGWKLKAIMAPHIDLRVGGPCYTHAYSYLKEEGEADLYIILGVAHYGGDGVFVATAKDFETPFGTVETDREFLNRWMENCNKDLTEEEWAHRTEHSIEFQLPFMQHALNHPFKILPVLCGSLQPFLENGRKPEDIAEIASLIEGLRKTIREEKKRIVFILSVDLAHMGPKFGDAEAINEITAQRIREADYKMFDIVSRFDREAFYDMMKNDLIPRRVDACSAIYTLLSILDEGKGETVGYGQNFQPDTGSLVSYGSMVFYEKVKSKR